MATPVIGITTTDRDEELATSPWYAEVFAVPAAYVDAVRRAGGNPVLLPPGETDWAGWLRILDGVVVTGGGDVAAERYGGDPDHPQQQPVLSVRDATEHFLAEEMAGGRMPSLFVCRGIQVLNVALGGTLHQHVADVAEDIHRGHEEGWIYHDVELEPGSLTAKVMGVEDASGATGHHQAIDRLAEVLRPVGWAADGTIEAVELETVPWLIGVQWHPEVSAATDPAQQGLFDGLVAAAREASSS